MILTVATSCFGRKNLPLMQIQVIGYSNIYSDLQIVLGLSISLVGHKNNFKMRLLVIAMVHYTTATANLFDIQNYFQ